MGIFSRLLGPRIKYDDKVVNLLPSANILAVSSFKNFLDAHNELKTVDPREWDFFVTVAGLSVGLMGLADKVRNESEYNRLTKILSTQILEWDKRGEHALSDLMVRLKNFREGMMALPPDEFTKLWASLISSWCFVNLKLEVPRNLLNNLMIDLGMLLIVSFHDWWSKS
jgi:hypothetical protein